MYSTRFQMSGSIRLGGISYFVSINRTLVILILKLCPFKLKKIRLPVTFHQVLVLTYKINLIQ